MSPLDRQAAIEHYRHQVVVTRLQWDDHVSWCIECLTDLPACRRGRRLSDQYAISLENLRKAQQ
jgi:hypothetical protein